MNSGISSIVELSPLGEMQRQRCRSDGCLWKGEWPHWSTLAKCASFSTLFAEESGHRSLDLEELRVQWRYRRNRKLQRAKALLGTRKSAEMWREGWPSVFLEDEPMPMRRRRIEKEELWYSRNCDCAVCYHRSESRFKGEIRKMRYFNRDNGEARP